MKDHCKPTQIKKNQANIIPTKETYKAPVSDSKEMEIYELPDIEFKIIILKHLDEMQKNADN